MPLEHLFAKLTQAHALSHAYIFSGNDHERKQALLAEIGGKLGWKEFQHPDLFVVQAEGAEAGAEITIAQIRQLYNHLSMGAWSAPYKVAICKDAHRMNREAQSAFLKLLEEPKGDTVFFLLTPHPEMLFDTIRSRAQEFRFYRFAPPEIKSELKAEFLKLQKASLHDRFDYAKKLADNAEQIPETLQNWLALTREMLHAALKENAKAALPLLSPVKTVQETLYLLRTTNINPRLALERLMLQVQVRQT